MSGAFDKSERGKYQQGPELQTARTLDESLHEVSKDWSPKTWCQPLNHLA